MNRMGADAERGPLRKCGTSEEEVPLPRISTTRFPAFLPTLGVLLLSSIHTRANTESAPCRFENSQCSCLFNHQEGGICLDKIRGSDLCAQRPCRGGWTCQCAGRTHLCNLNRVRVLVPAIEPSAPKPAPDANIPCDRSPQRIVSSLQIVLGWVSFGISYQGLREGDCSRFTWFLNGRKMAEFDDSTAEGSAIPTHRSMVFHDKLEMRPGDVVAFRFQRSSYYCFSNSVLMHVNGTSERATAPAGDRFEAYYNRASVTGWKSKNLVIDQTNSKPEESAAGPEDWIPWRTRKLVPPRPALPPSQNNWKPRDETNLDDRRGKWFFRFKIPKPQ